MQAAPRKTQGRKARGAPARLHYRFQQIPRAPPSFCPTFTPTQSLPPHAARVGKIHQTLRLDQRLQPPPSEVPQPATRPFHVGTLHRAHSLPPPEKSSRADEAACAQS